jgi:hypothetical protein
VHWPRRAVKQLEQYLALRLVEVRCRAIRTRAYITVLHVRAP